MEVVSSSLAPDMPMLLRSLMQRRVPHILTIYLAASWGVVQFVDFAVEEFLLSPHWTRVSLIALLLLLPSVVVLGWFRGKPGRERETLAKTEKIGIPANLVLCAAVLWVLFAGEDLGAATTSVTVETEDGETIERIVPKSEFRKRTALFPFDPGPGLGEEDGWMAYMLPSALQYDLMPDDFFEPIPYVLFGQRLLELGFPDLLNVPLALKREVSEQLHAEFIAGGTIDWTGDRYRLTLRVHEVATGSLVGETAHEGPDPLSLVDALSLDAKGMLKIPARDGIEDLPVRERFTESDEAMEEFGRALEKMVAELDLQTALQHLRTATSLDPTFAVAQYTLATVLLLTASPPGEAVTSMQAALDNLYRVPERARFVIKSDYYFLTQQTDKAWSVVEMWVELYPEDLQALRNYLLVQRLRGDWQGMLTTLGTMYRLSPHDANLLRAMADVHLELGNDDEALSVLSDYLTEFPEDHAALVSLAGIHRRHGEHDVAREHLERATMLQPRLPELVVELASLNVEVGRFGDAFEGYERAMDLARTPAQRASVLAALKRYYSLRGESENTIRTAARWEEDASRFMVPATVIPVRFSDIVTLFDLGRVDDGVALFQKLSAKVEPPLSDYMVPRLAIYVALETEGIEAAREAHSHAVEVAETNQFGVILPRLMSDLGRIEERAGDYEAAIESYRAAMELDPGGNLHRQVGRVLRKAGRLDEAESELREALRRVPAHPRTHLEMALLLEVRGDTAGAVEHLGSALAAWENADESFEPAREAREKLAELGG